MPAPRRRCTRCGIRPLPMARIRRAAHRRAGRARHARLTTTQIYLTPRSEDVIRRVLGPSREQSARPGSGPCRRRRQGTGPRHWRCCSGQHLMTIQADAGTAVAPHLCSCTARQPGGMAPPAKASRPAGRQRLAAPDEPGLGPEHAEPGAVHSPTPAPGAGSSGRGARVAWLADQPAAPGSSGGWHRRPSRRGSWKQPCNSWLDERGVHVRQRLDCCRSADPGHLR